MLDLPSGSPSFLTFLRNVTDSIQIPNSDKTVRNIWDGDNIDVMGTGSDHTAFMLHSAISSLAMGMGSYDGSYGAVYHSNYDSYYWFTHWGDPTFGYHATMAKVYGTIALRLADDFVLPFEFKDYTSALVGYFNTLSNTTTMLNFTAMQSAIQHFGAAAASIDNEISQISQSSSWGSRRSVNDRLMLTERAFLGTAVESGKEWYYHVIYAPDDFNSYGGQTFPAIYKAIAKQDWALADFLIKRIAQIIDEAAYFLSGELWQGNT